MIAERRQMETRKKKTDSLTEEQMEAERQAGTRKRRRRRQVLVVKGQCSCDKVCLDSMLTASGRTLVNTIPVHFTGHSRLSRAHKDGSIAV